MTQLMPTSQSQPKASPKQFPNCAGEALDPIVSTPLASVSVLTGLSVSINTPLMSRFCLLCQEGLIAKHTLVSDPSPFNTWHPEHAHQFVTCETAIRARNSVLHLHPEIQIVHVTYAKSDADWLPICVEPVSGG